LERIRRNHTFPDGSWDTEMIEWSLDSEIKHASEMAKYHRNYVNDPSDPQFCVLTEPDADGNQKLTSAGRSYARAFFLMGVAHELGLPLDGRADG
tara:strand:- start:771 stop:1055 length:285 start_codon:yes stop_codon:yes gene_type:complete